MPIIVPYVVTVNIGEEKAVGSFYILDCPLLKSNYLLSTIFSKYVDIGNIRRYNGRMKGGDPMKGQYHHGNLKHDLIEFAIQTISEEGPERLSLRNISKQCGVSHNAIYRHFAGKDELMAACQE